MNCVGFNIALQVEKYLTWFKKMYFSKTCYFYSHYMYIVLCHSFACL